jgi:hypothetical protein
MAKPGPGKYADGPALRAAVEAEDDLLVASMEDIRRAHGKYGKLGPHVQVQLAKWLKNEGLGSLPAGLARYQHEEVRLYRLGTAMADVIEAVLEPSEPGDRELRKYVSMNGAAQRQLDEIRAMLEE